MQIRQSQRLDHLMIQSQQLLAMNTVELSTHLEEIAQDNPLLELEFATEESIGLIEDFSANRTWEPGYTRLRQIENDSLACSGSSLEEYLFLQLDKTQLSPEEIDAFNTLVCSLNESGYLEEDLNDLSAFSGLPLKVYEDMLRELKRMDPVGIGACNVHESMVLQLEYETPLDKVALCIVNDYLDLLAENKVEKIAKNLNLSLGVVLDSIEHIRRLEPRPALAFAAPSAEYVIPDVVVHHRDEGLEVEMGPIGVCGIGISSHYRLLGQNTCDRDAKEWINEHYKQAYWLRTQVKQRQNTVMRLMLVLLDVQWAFFASGTAYLRNVSMTEVASMIGVSVSTVSRATRGKYFQCKWGTYPIAYLFSASTVATGIGGSVGVKKLIRELIASEENEHPLSDQEITKRLLAQGVAISRRTAARYREEMGIASAGKRRFRKAL